jgi:cytochrome c biogenesis protein
MQESEMIKNETSFGALKEIWSFFASVKLTVVLLALLASASIFGTVVPQNENPAMYIQAYGEFKYRILYAFDIFDMYHSWWFRSMIVLITINIIVCSLNRFPSVWRIVTSQNPAFNLKRFRNLDDYEEFTEEYTNDKSHDEIIKIIKGYVSKKFGYYRTEKIENGSCILAQKGSWTRLGVYCVHLSVVALLVGALLGSMFGFDGYVEIPEGGSVNNIRLRSGGMQSLDFEINCEKFNVSFYKSGEPKEYRSSLNIIENGKIAYKKDIIVNDPLHYKGINIFQSSYNKIPSGELELEFENRKTGKKINRAVSIGKEVKLSSGLEKFTLLEFKNGFKFRGANVGEVYVGKLYPEKGEPVDIILPVHLPSFDRMRNGEWLITITGEKEKYSTGLQVTKDPGVPLVYAGFIMIILGCYITFFMSHQKICIEISDRTKHSQVRITGTSNKNKIGMLNNLKNISRDLRKLF